MFEFKMPKLGVGNVSLNREPSAREKVFFFVVVAIMLILFLDSLWKPETKKIIILKTQLNSIEMQRESAKRLIDATHTQIEKTKTEPKQHLETDDFVKKVLEREVVDETDEMNSIADLLGSKKLTRKVTVSKVEIGSRTDTQNYIEVPITVQFEGRYSGVRDYFKAVEALERAVIIDSFKIVRNKEKTSLLEVTLEIMFYMPKNIAG